MRKSPLAFLGLVAAVFLVAGAGLSQQVTELRLDPLLLVSLKEARNITRTLGDELFPGWDFQKTPVLFYRPKVQELLIGFPHKPEGFAEFKGQHPLGEETILVRNDTTLFNIDDQNTVREMDGVSVLVVADAYSRMRNQLRGVLLGRPREFAAGWLEEWNFVTSPYKELRLILHEGFHVYQDRMAPGKQANEMVVTRYPVLDPVNNALSVLEGRILRDALLGETPQARMEKLRQFVAVRSFRHARLPKEAAEYESLNEFREGTAKYVEYKFLKAGERVEPVREMYYHTGFNGYRGVLAREYREAVDDLPKVVSARDPRFDNQFGSGPLRLRLYELGACQALLLDEVSPEWKTRIFEAGMYLSDLLRSAAKLPEEDLQKYLERAKAEYNYEEAHKDFLQFEQEGKQLVKERVARALASGPTVVRIEYAALSGQAMVARFTPFGVTQVGEGSTLYEMVPALVVFKKGVTLDFKRPIPLLLDTTNRVVVFAVATPAAGIEAGLAGKVETPEFVLSAGAVEILREGNTVTIRLK
jgi:hypothetical protein